MHFIRTSDNVRLKMSLEVLIAVAMSIRERNGLCHPIFKYKITELC